MKLEIKKGQTSKLIEVFISDSSSTTGAGLTGLVYNSASLTAYYYRSGAASATVITLVTMTVGTWASGGFKEIDAANLPGWYQLGIPDAALVTGVDQIGMHLKGATNMAPLPLEIQLVDKIVNDLNDIASTDIVSAGAITTLSGAIVNVDTVDVCATNTDMRGTNNAALASVCTESRLAELGASNMPLDLDTLTTLVLNHESSRSSMEATLVADIAAVQLDLDNPAQYKADISALALEATAQLILSNTASIPTSGDIADAVWDETLSDHIADTTSTGYALSMAVDVVGNNLIVINIEDIDTSNPIPDVFVRITDSAVSQTFHRGYTDYLGQINAVLDDGSYNVLLRKAFYDFTVPETLTVAGSGTETYAGSGFAASTPSASGDTCVVYGWVTDIGGTSIRNAKIEVIESDTRRFNDTQKIVKTTKSIRSSISGYFELELIRSSLLTPSGIPYSIKITYPGFEYITTIIVPDTNSAELSTLV